jgi:hypothetical protein
METKLDDIIIIWGVQNAAPTWVAMYVIKACVTQVIPWIRALPEHVALAALSTELGDVKTYLYDLDEGAR